MSKNKIKSPLAILFTAVIAFFGVAIFPLGYFLYVVISSIASTFVPEQASTIGIYGVIALALMASLYSIIDDLHNSMGASEAFRARVLADIQELKTDKKVFRGTTDALYDEVYELQDTVSAMKKKFYPSKNRPTA